MERYLKNGIFFLIFLSMEACQQKDAKQAKSTAFAGEITVSADETLFPLLDAEKTIFENTYPEARVQMKYTSETDAIKDLMEQKIPIAVVGRKLTPEEEQYFQKKSLVPRYTRIATDAVVAIVHPNNPDTAIVFSQLLKILKGESKSWKSLNPASPLGKIDIVFDNQNSGTVSFILNLTQQTALPPNAYATKSNKETILYVAEHPDAIGLVGWSWLSDSDDPLAKEFKQRTKIVALTSASTEGATAQVKTFYKPYQLNLSNESYPMGRDVFVINCEGYVGLGSSFTSFMAGEQGQRIVLKAGLVPSFPPTRWVEFVEKPLN